MSIREDVIRLGEELAKERNAAFDLWSWLPSHAAAEKHHGDYSDTKFPGVEQVLIEACFWFSDQKYPKNHTDAERREMYRCPCGEDDEELTDADADPGS